MKKVVLVVLVVVLVAVGFAYAAANEVPVTGAGDGDEEISGYDVSDVHYVLNSSDPGNIDKVTFKLTPLIGTPDTLQTVKIKLFDGGSWITCNEVSGTWTCPENGTTGVTVLQADNLRVVAAQ